VSKASAVTDMKIRSFRDEDEAEVLELLRASLGAGPGGNRTSEFFKWKHLSNPFGRSYMLVAEIDRRIIGLRAFMRWRFRGSQGTIRAVRAVDTATHPDQQGRGVFSTLTRRALEVLAVDTDVVYNTPNDKSLPGYLKMGWGVVGRVPIAVRVRRPMRLLMNGALARGGELPTLELPRVNAASAAEVLEDGRRIAPLLDEAGVLDGRIMTLRTPEYLRWRYASAPLLDYHAAIAEEAGEVVGLVVFRVRSRGRLCEAMVTELLVRRGDHATGRRLLRRVVHAAGVDHLTCSFPEGTSARRASRACGFVSTGKGVMLVANLLGPVSPDPRRLESWAITLGDVEVF